MSLIPAVITVLIGNFLIGLLFKPALDRLTEIRDGLLSIVLPPDRYTRSFRSQPWNAEKFEEENEAARHAVSEIIRKYSLAYRSFRRIGIVFLIALLALVNLTVSMTTFNVWMKLFLGLLMTGIILGGAKMLAPDAYPSPAHLMNVDYLAQHFQNIQPMFIVRLLDIGAQRAAWEDSSQLVLSCAVPLSEYKFFLAMTNEDKSRLHFIAYGKVGDHTPMNPIILPDYYRWHVPVGELDPKWPAGLDLPVWTHLFVLLPTPAGWRNADSFPYFVSHDLWIPIPGEPHRAGENLRLATCNTRTTDRYVTFRRDKTKFGEKWTITSVNVEGNAPHVRLRKLLRFYRRELENATGITVLSGPRLPKSFS
jgi:hypothetical protein